MFGSLSDRDLHYQLCISELLWLCRMVALKSLPVHSFNALIIPILRGCLQSLSNIPVSKFSVGLKTLLHQGLSEPVFYGDLVYKFKQIVGRVDFSGQFRKIIVRYKLIGFNINIMRQSACLLFKPITVNNFASLFNCTPVGRASDSMMAPT